jgi:hypothetical protein
MVLPSRGEILVQTSISGHSTRLLRTSSIL